MLHFGLFFREVHATPAPTSSDLLLLFIISETRAKQEAAGGVMGVRRYVRWVPKPASSESRKDALPPTRVGPGYALAWSEMKNPLMSAEDTL